MVTDTFKTEVFKPETDEAFIILMSLDHDDLAGPIRVASMGTL